MHTETLHTHIYVCGYTYLDLLVFTDVRTYVQTYIQTDIYINTCIHTYTYTLTHTHTFTHACMHTSYIHPYMYSTVQHTEALHSVESEMHEQQVNRRFGIRSTAKAVPEEATAREESCTRGGWPGLASQTISAVLLL